MDCCPLHFDLIWILLLFLRLLQIYRAVLENQLFHFLGKKSLFEHNILSNISSSDWKTCID